MTLADARYAAQLITTSGKTFVFDDPGCLAAFYAGGEVPRDKVGSVWVNNYLAPGDWLDARTAVFIHAPGLRTPMASGLAAVRPGAEADSLRAALGGTVLTWDAVVARQRSGV